MTMNVYCAKCGQWLVRGQFMMGAVRLCRQCNDKAFRRILVLRKVLEEMMMGMYRCNRVLPDRLELRYRAATREIQLHRLLFFRRRVFPSALEVVVVSRALEFVVGHGVEDPERIIHHGVLGYVLLWKPDGGEPVQRLLPFGADVFYVD